MSTGARREAVIAIESMLTLLDVKGRELLLVDLLEQDARARCQLRAEDFRDDVVDEYMPYIDFAAIEVVPGDQAGQSRRLADSAWETVWRFRLGQT